MAIDSLRYHPFFKPLFACSDKFADGNRKIGTILVEQAKKIAAFVSALFTNAGIWFTRCYQILFRRREPEIQAPPVFPRLFAVQAAPIQLAVGGNAPIRADNTLPDVPVDLEAMKAAIRWGWGVPLSRRLTARDFIALVDHFAAQPGGHDRRMQIAEAAKRWAEAQPLAIDPGHRFFEIFQAAFRFKGQIPGSLGKSNDWRGYACRTEQYVHGPHWEYVLYQLMGFQEGERADNLELMRKLDNGSRNSLGNPCYTYQRAAMRIYGYPSADYLGDLVARHTIHQGIGCMWSAYQLAKAQNKLPEFFTGAFRATNTCFAIRCVTAQEWMEPYITRDAAEFAVELPRNPTIEAKVGAYWGVFRNKQILAYAQAHLHPGEDLAAAYRETKRRITLQPNMHNPEYLNYREFIANFERDHLTRDQFAAYLAAAEQPIRKKALIPAGAEINLWTTDGVVFDPNRPFMEVEGWRINRNQQQVGRVIGVKDDQQWNRYAQAKVHRLIPERDKVQLDLRGEPVSRQEWEAALDTLGL